MAPISLRPSHRGVKVLIALAAVLFIGCIFAYVGAAEKLNRTSKEVDEKAKEVSDSEMMAQKLERSKLEYMDAQSQLRCLETSVTTQAYVPTLLKQLEYLGKSTDLKVVGIRPDLSKINTSSGGSSSSSSSSGSNSGSSSGSSSSDGAAASSSSSKKDTKPYDELNVEVDAKGNYMNVLDFIYKLTSFPKIMQLKNINITPSTQGDKVVTGSPELTIKMNVTAFIMKIDEAKDTQKTEMSSTGRSGNDAG